MLAVSAMLAGGFAAAVGFTAQAAPGATADPSPAVCAKHEESMRIGAVAGWRFCPHCGQALKLAGAAASPEGEKSHVSDKPAVAAVAKPLPPQAADDFAEAFRLDGPLYRNRVKGFRLTVPPTGDWQIVTDPRQVLRLDAAAEVALVRPGDVMVVVRATKVPASMTLAEYALKVPPRGLIRGLEIPEAARSGQVDGQPYIRREYEGLWGGQAFRYGQFLTGRGDVKFQLLTNAPAAALTEQVRGEITALENSFGFVGPAPIDQADATEAATAEHADRVVRGDALIDRQAGWRVARPGAAWQFVIDPATLTAQGFPPETVAAMIGPDGLFAALLVATVNPPKSQTVSSRPASTGLAAFAESVKPDLANLVSGRAITFDLDGRAALRVEYRGRLALSDGTEALLNYRQTLVAHTNDRRLQFVIWGPTDAVDRHLSEIETLEKSLRFALP